MSCDPRIGHRRRRIEWPSQDAKIQDLFGEVLEDESIDPYEETKNVVQHHLDCIDCKDGYTPDIPIGDEYYGRDRNWRGLLRNLYWRARKQSCMYDVFELLASRQLVDINCLASVVNLKGIISPQTSMIKFMLYCFQFPRDDEDKALDGAITLQNMDWECEQTWLATMISRGGNDLREIFLTIDHSRMLGPADENALSEWFSKHTATTGQFPLISPLPFDNLERHHADPSFKKIDNTFGFILPHNLGQFYLEAISELLRPFRRHLEDIEVAVIKEFNLPGGNIVLESDQQAYFANNPDRLPGSENDIPDGEYFRESSGSAGSP